MHKKPILDKVKTFYATESPPKDFVPGQTYIPVSGCVITPEDVAAVVDAAMDGWFTEGKRCAAFVRSFSKRVGKRNITLCNSGSSANLLAIMAASEGRLEKLVVTCAVGFPTTVSPIYQAGKIPLYVDIDPETLTPRIDQAIEALDRYKSDIAGIVLAHNLGFPCREYIIGEHYGEAGKFTIADCCDALGARVLDFPVGHYCDISTFSFFPAHHISCGEGGAVATNSPKLHRVIQSLANWGRDCHCAPGQSNTCGQRFCHESAKTLPSGWDHKYTFTRLGYNLKMTELQAALGLSQLNRLDDILVTRNINHSDLYSALGEWMEFVDFVDTEDSRLHASPFGFVVRVLPKAPFPCEELIAWLEAHKIATRRIFGGNLTRQPAFDGLPYVSVGDFRGANEVMERMFWIGVHPWITSDVVTYISEKFREFMERYPCNVP